jgi:predicted transcriptional regulator
MLYEKLLLSLIESNEGFVSIFKKILFEQKMTVLEFCKSTGIPESTVYKIMSNPEKDFRVSTLRQIIKAIRKMEGVQLDETTIGIITTRGALDFISRAITYENKQIRVKEYPATTIEEEIIQGVRAEREGVKGIICGPVAATTLEKVVNIPVIAIRFEERLLMDAIRNLAKKI